MVIANAKKFSRLPQNFTLEHYGIVDSTYVSAHSQSNTLQLPKYVTLNLRALWNCQHLVSLLAHMRTQIHAMIGVPQN